MVDYYKSDKFDLSGSNLLADRMKGLDFLIDAICVESTILDIGCAEGLISREFLKSGASIVHGFDKEESRVEKAQNIMSYDYKMMEQYTFGVGNINSIDKFEKEWNLTLHTKYDIVLLLGVFHSIEKKNRELVLHRLSERCHGIFAVRTIKQLETFVNMHLCRKGFRLIYKCAGIDRKEYKTGKLLIYER